MNPIDEQAGGSAASALAGSAPGGGPSGIATPGEYLQRERERKGLSVQQAAENLHLDTWVINAIETNKFSDLGAPVYAKGHLKKYAALLGLPSESVMDRYQSLGTAPAPELVPRRKIATTPPRRANRVALMLGWLALIVIIAMAIWAAWQG
jgi:cytoskeleton protein RodZ